VSWWVCLCLWLWLWVFENVCEKCEIALHASVWEFVWIVIVLSYLRFDTCVFCYEYYGLCDMGGGSVAAWGALVPTYAC